MILALYSLIQTIIQIYIWVLIISAVMSWLVAFDLLNVRSRAVQSIRVVLFRLTEPLLSPIRRFLPDLGGIDISPVILIVLLWFVSDLLRQLLIGARTVSL